VKEQKPRERKRFSKQENKMSIVKALTLVEQDIQEELRRSPPPREPRPLDYAPPAIRTPPMPAYVEHREGVSDVGKLSAEALVREYEATAKTIETMGNELKTAASKCEEMTAGVHAMIGEVNALAERYRSEGKRIFEQIEGCSLMTDEVRKLCSTLAEKIAAPGAAS
jgi:hypothetical protein